MKNKYSSYEQALDILNLDTLDDRREILCLKFAKKCAKHRKTKDMFPLNPSDDKNTREREKYLVQHATTSRLRDSTLPQLQRALNTDDKK